MIPQNHSNNLIFIIYDGIENSVFQSQVLQPLITQLQECQEIVVTLISYERKKFSHEQLQKIIPTHDRFHVIIRYRLPFMIPGSLWLAAYQLNKILRTQKSDTVMARGPMAGLIAQRATQFLKETPNLKVQARGLCAEEYRYAHEKSSYLCKAWHWFRYQQFKKLERNAYANKDKITIEAVSPALKDYLIKEFGADASHISIASRDIPQIINKEHVGQWRKQARHELNIPNDAFVYCYSGSHKPWQCVTESIAYVVQQYQKDPKSFLLVLSQDQKKFEAELTINILPATSYRILSVHPEKLFYYLAAADAGLLFRDKDIVNWVSRPTKMLEYLAVGIGVIHNDTVAWLVTQK